MACAITITNVKGFRLPGESQPYAIEVQGTAIGCSKVYVGTSCFKPSGAYGDVTDGNWNVTIYPRPGSNRCTCNDQITVVAYCADVPQPVSCTPGQYSGTLSCEQRELGPCPKDVVIRIFDGYGHDISPQITHDICQLQGLYHFRIEAIPPMQPGWSVSLTIKVEVGAIWTTIDPATDSRIQNLLADNTEFDFLLNPGEVVEVIATLVSANFPADGCALRNDAAQLRGCAVICTEPGQYNPITGTCCPDGQYYNPDRRGCEPRCPQGQTFNPVTGRCESEVVVMVAMGAMGTVVVMVVMVVVVMRDSAEVGGAT
jgi:hypothetical protein